MKKLTYEEAYGIIKKAVVEETGLSEKEVQPSAHFKYDLQCDSLDAVCITLNIEECLCIDITDHDAEKINTVQDAINYLLSLVWNKKKRSNRNGRIITRT